GITGVSFFSAQTQVIGTGWNNYGTSAMALTWRFSGQNSNNGASGQNYNQFASPAMNYSGYVSAAGTVNIGSTLSLGGFCPSLPA
ncbi:hypothetical protein ACI3PL_27185, partial [Lacticaseibacillus paracasei]